MALAEKIAKCLRERSETLSVAESCTGGGLAEKITEHPGISHIFLGGITTYANSAKEKILFIPHEILEDKGAVSEETALLMAKNCKDLFSTTWALSTTGIAGPTGGTKEKPTGLVWIGLAGPHISLAKRYLFANANRLEHRQKTIEQALALLAEHISTH